MADLTYRELVDAGEVGDTPLNVKLTVRQLSVVEFLLEQAVEQGVGFLALTAVASIDVDLAERFRLEFARAQARIGIELQRVLGNDDKVLEFAARLAQYDQEVAGLD